MVVAQTSSAILVDHFIRSTKQIETEEAVRQERQMRMSVHNTLVRAALICSEHCVAARSKRGFFVPCKE